MGNKQKVEFPGASCWCKERLSTPAIQSLFLKSFGSGAMSIWMTFHILFQNKKYSNLKWRSGGQEEYYNVPLSNYIKIKIANMY